MNSEFIALTDAVSRVFYQRASSVVTIRPSYSGFFVDKEVDGSYVDTGYHEFYVKELPGVVLAMLERSDEKSEK